MRKRRKLNHHGKCYPNKQRRLERMQRGVKTYPIVHEQEISLSSELTIWDSNANVRHFYQQKDKGIEAVRNIVNLASSTKDTARRLGNSLYSLVFHYFDAICQDNNKGLSTFVDAKKRKVEIKKMTLVFMGERLANNNEGKDAFQKAYKRGDSLSNVKGCHYAWKKSSQEAAKVLQICLQLSSSYKKLDNHENAFNDLAKSLCHDAAMEIRV